MFYPLQGQTGKYFFVVQTGTFALKLPAKQPEHAGDQGAPEQTVSALAISLHAATAVAGLACGCQ